MSREQETKLGGCWKKQSRDGSKEFYKGKIEISTLKEAVKKAGLKDGDKMDITLWVNKEKFSENSRDLNMVAGPPYEAPARQEPPDDDVPF